MKKINIKYFDKELTNIEQKEHSDWIDLRSSIDIDLKQNKFYLIPLGVAMELPKGYEAHIAPRSSTYKNYGIIQTNSLGIVDESYCGNNDQWFYPVYATQNRHITKNDRICQFRIVKKQPSVTFNIIDKLGNKNRGGFGSTGIK